MVPGPLELQVCRAEVVGGDDCNHDHHTACLLLDLLVCLDGLVNLQKHIVCIVCVVCEWIRHDY